ncbi:hypothetical protein [Rhizobium sp.]|uniref:hypothetical protein n=1 Tax=Rhizobium sp. TaxID=391 RepID=UPI003F808724
MTKESVTFRLEPGVKDRIEGALSKLPYRPTITAFMERGINLAINEIEASVPRANVGLSLLAARKADESAVSISKAESSREATPAVETVSAQRGVAAFESGCHALIDDVGGQ